MDNKQPSPGEWAMMGGAVVALLGSFLDISGDVSAWGRGAFPIVTLIPLYCVVAGVLVAGQRFGNVSLPDRLAGFGAGQLSLALGFFATLMSLCWLIAADDTGAGLFLLLVGSAAVLVGAVLVARQQAPTVG